MVNSSTGSNESNLFDDILERNSKLGDFEDRKSFLLAISDRLHYGKDLEAWSVVAKAGPGYIRCEELGVYVVTEEFFNQTF